MLQLPSLIAEALVASGHTSLDDQAKALGLPRSTTWTIIASKHKIGRLSNKVRARMLENPDLPALVRAALENAPQKATPVMAELRNQKSLPEQSQYVPQCLKSRR
jgi:hypothetical protein